jgi:hypothetical protein
MSITWYKLKIKRQANDYECYIRYKFDFQMQSIRIKAFIYLTDSDGNICVTEKKNKLGYDPRILGSLTVEKNFLKHKRKNNANTKAKYFEVMKYQGNFNICNLPLIDDYFRNGKALFYQYKNMLYLMDNNKYKIQIEPKKFTIILDVLNYGYISLNLFNKLEEVEKQELIFLKQNEEALCHRYFSNKYQGKVKNKKDGEEIEIIEENKNFNQFGGRICIGGEENESQNIEEEKDKKDDNYCFEQNDEFDENSDDSSVYDSIYSARGNSKNNEKLNINKCKFYINGKNFANDNPRCNVILNGNQTSIKKMNKSRFFNNNNFNNNSYTNNENYNNFFIKLRKDDSNLLNYNKANNFQNQKSLKNSNNKDLNFYEKAKNIVNKYNLQKDINNLETNSTQSKKTKNDINHNNNGNGNCIDNNKSFNILCKRIISQKKNESLVPNEAERKILLNSSGFDNTKYCLKLLYKSSLHGDNTISFNNKCDNKKNEFIIILTLDNQKFGFYTSIGLSSDKKIVYDNNAFLFKLSKPEVNCFHIKQSEIAFYGYSDYVLYLGGEQLVIKDKFLSGASYCGMKMKNYKINNNYQINNGNRNFIIKELEVYIISDI